MFIKSETVQIIQLLFCLLCVLNIGLTILVLRFVTANRNHLAELNNKLHESEIRHHMLIDGVDDYAVYWLDARGYVNSWNLGAFNLKGYTEQEIVGKHFSVFFTDEDRNAGIPDQILADAAANGKFAGEGYRIRKDGSKFWAQVIVQPIRDKAGTSIGFAKICRDETERKQTQDSLKLGEATLKLGWRGTDVGTWDWDPSTDKVIYSDRFKELLGYSAHEISNDIEEWRGRLHPDDRQTAMSAIYAHTNHQSPYDVEYRLLTKTGVWRWFHAKGQCVWDSSGNPSRMAGTLADITEDRLRLQTLKSSQEAFRAAMEGAAVGMAQLDLAGRILKVNPALCLLFGRKEQELLGTAFGSLASLDDRDTDHDYLEKLIAGDLNIYQGEQLYRHKSGRSVWSLVSMSVMRDSSGAPECLMAQIQDISDQKEVERIKSEFISIVSHELRTPLTAIRGSLALMRGGVVGEMPPKVMDMTKIAYNNTERLILLINDILDMNKIESGQMRFNMSEHDLSAVVNQAVDANQPYGQKYGVRFVVEPLSPPALVCIDTDRLVQVISNLLSNAAKFSKIGDDVCVSFSRHSDKVRISVTDRGQGIPEEFRPRIFSKFAQADSSSTRQKGGTGLGLNISKQMIERMNGEIGFESRLNMGTKFWIDLSEMPSPN